MHKEHEKEDRLRSLVKNTAIIFCIMFMLAMTWEAQKTDAAVAGGPIPQESIRLRILANSDNPDDQLVKRQIRDVVVAQMDSWVKDLENPQSLDEARTTIRQHLPELNDLVGRELEKKGIDYEYNVELGVVPFPTKLYGGTVYPAGNYEALRITLGTGTGQNWWCVLFPPLCFIDAGSGDAAAQPAAAKAETGKDQAAKVKKTAYTPEQAEGQAVNAEAAPVQASEPEVRFFLWDLFEGIANWLKSLF
ncbi:stage II sporulation protein R [Paenibacillus dokdonensis]|uniref:Stage II sporulation protein R n=1 Tax=Paenibacillus dokdonensis TaxID=2567944 RepID=A0ABU6GSK6_9BACL|nr:stage II sporulation protein R [Paenibacillus dokdonensis]MEC0242731.1 stage II sporulation protein R [Paenibacillus dokdonensis]